MASKAVKRLIMCEIQINEHVQKYIDNTDWVIYPEFILEHFRTLIGLSEKIYNQYTGTVMINDGDIVKFIEDTELILQGIIEKEKDIEPVIISEHDFVCLNFLRITETILNSAKDSTLYVVSIRDMIKEQIKHINAIWDYIDSI